MYVHSWSFPINVTKISYNNVTYYVEFNNLWFNFKYTEFCKSSIDKWATVEECMNTVGQILYVY